MSTENEQEVIKETIGNHRPLLLRAMAISVMILGVLGVIFFLPVLLFTWYNADFAIRYSQIYSSLWMFQIYLIIMILLHGVLLWTGNRIYQIKKQAITGLWITGAGFLLLTWLANHEIFWTELLLTGVFLLIIYSYKRRLH